MHDGCSGSFEDGKRVVDKLRMMRYSQQKLPMAFEIKCKGCGKKIEMTTFEYKCEECGMVHGVTPCHGHDANAVLGASVDY